MTVHDISAGELAHDRAGAELAERRGAPTLAHGDAGPTSSLRSSPFGRNHMTATVSVAPPSPAYSSTGGSPCRSCSVNSQTFSGAYARRPLSDSTDHTVARASGRM